MKYRLIHFLLPISIIMTACVPAGPVSTATRQPTATAAPTRTPSPAPTATVTPTFTPSPTPLPAWAKEMMERLQELQNKVWLLGPEEMILRKSENPMVRHYEDKENLLGGPVPIKDRRLFALNSNELMYDYQTVGRFEKDELVFTDQKTGEEVRVSKENLQWAIGLTDDGLNNKGGLDNQRVVVRLEVLGEAPAEAPAVLQESGFEGEWVEWVFQEGQWHLMPPPKMMIEALELLGQGMTIEEVMAKMQAELPDDWHDLPVVDSEVVDIYLRQQAGVWEELKKMITPEEWVLRGSFLSPHRLPLVNETNFGLSTTFGYKNVNSPINAVLLGDSVVLSYITNFVTSADDSGRLVLFNFVVNQKTSDYVTQEVLKPVGWDYVPFDNAWSLIKDGKVNNKPLEFDLVLGIKSEDDTTEALLHYNDLLKWVARNEGSVPRGELLADRTVLDMGGFWSFGHLYGLFIGLLGFGSHLRVGLPNGETAEYEVLPGYQLEALEQLLVPAVPMVPAPGK